MLLCWCGPTLYPGLHLLLATAGAPVVGPGQALRRLDAVSRPLPRSSRRAALGWGLAVAMTGSACSAGTAPVALGTPSPRPNRATRRSDPEQSGDVDPDTLLVTQLLEDLSVAHERVRTNRRAHRPLAGRLRRLERLHAQHAIELGGLVTVAPGSVAAEKREGRVLARVSASEESLQRRLVRGSIVADSGALALLLAAMAAGVAQERARL